jgi:phage baseplate assembly protein W
MLLFTHELNIFMASIKISGLPISQSPGVAYTYEDLHLDIRKKYLIKENLRQYPEINDIVLDYDYSAIKNSIKNIFNTMPGEKILNPDFGLNLKQFLFDPITNTRASDIASIISTKLEKYEPRVKITFLSVVPVPENNQYDIQIVISLPTLNQTNVSFIGALNNAGFSYI